MVLVARSRREGENRQTALTLSERLGCSFWMSPFLIQRETQSISAHLASACRRSRSKHAAINDGGQARWLRPCARWGRWVRGQTVRLV